MHKWIMDLADPCAFQTPSEAQNKIKDSLFDRSLPRSTLEDT